MIKTRKRTSYKLYLSGLILLLLISIVSCVEQCTEQDVCIGYGWWGSRCINGKSSGLRLLEECSEKCGCDPQLKGLVPNPYLGIGHVIDTGYAYMEGTNPSNYDPDSPIGYRTGQWIDVEVLMGKMNFNSWYRPGETVRGIWSYGGDVGIIGKLEVGDLVGFYFGNYVEIWEKIEIGATTGTDHFAEESIISIEICLVNYDAPGNDNFNLNEEWIRICNTGNQDVDMSGWKMYDESYREGRAHDHVYYFPSGFVLKAGQSVTIYTGSGMNTANKLYWDREEGDETGQGAVWTNDGDCVCLVDDQGSAVDGYCW